MSDGTVILLKANSDVKSIPCHGNRVPVGVTRKPPPTMHRRRGSEQAREQIEQRPHGRAGRNGDEPGRHYPLGHGPAHRAGAAGGAGSDHAAGDGVRGRNGNPHRAGAEHDDRARRGSAEAGVVIEPRQPRAHRPDDPPSPGQGAERDGDITTEHDPFGHVELAPEIACGIEQHGDDAHGLLGVVAAVADRVGGRRAQVEELEEAVGPARLRAAEHPACHQHEQHGDGETDHRRKEDRQDRLGCARAFDRADAAVRDPRAEQAADQCMARR